MIKRLLRNHIALAALAMTAASASAVTAPNLVTNGSFNAVTGSTIGGWTDIYGTNSNNLIGLRTGIANNFGGSPLINMSTDADGGSYLAIYRGFDTAYNLPNYTQGVSQTISGLTVGHVYQLTFYDAATTGYRGDTSGFNWQVSFEGQTQYGGAIGPGAYNDRYCDTCATTGSYTVGNFTMRTLTFTATTTSSLLKFAAAMPTAPNAPSNYNIFLDGISLIDTTPVPEPSSVALSVAGLAALGAVVRRRARRPA